MPIIIYDDDEPIPVEVRKPPHINLLQICFLAVIGLALLHIVVGLVATALIITGTCKLLVWLFYRARP